MHQAPVTAITIHKVTGRVIAAANDGTITAITSVVSAQTSGCRCKCTLGSSLWRGT